MRFAMVHVLHLFAKFELYVRLTTSFPENHSHIKIHLWAHFTIQWQDHTNYSDKDRCTYDLVPVASLAIFLLIPSTTFFSHWGIPLEIQKIRLSFRECGIIALTSHYLYNSILQLACIFTILLFLVRLLIFRRARLCCQRLKTSLTLYLYLLFLIHFLARFSVFPSFMTPLSGWSFFFSGSYITLYYCIFQKYCFHYIRLCTVYNLALCST